MAANVKDRCPKVRGSARAYMLLWDRLVFEYMRMPDGSQAYPMVHQCDGFALMRTVLDEHGAFGLLHDMGCGKTLTMIALLLTMHEEGLAESMFVACPSSVVGSWQGECERLNLRARERQRARGEEERDVIECVGLTQTGVPKREAALKKAIADRAQRREWGEVLPPLLVATNYEGTWRMEKTLREAGFTIEACDESQKIKAADSKQSKAMHRIGRVAPYKVIMTGTPVPEGGLDWYGQWRFAKPEILGTNVQDFRAQYALEIPVETADGKSFRKYIVNPHNKSRLEGLIFPLVHRVSKDEAVDLPEQFPARIEFDLTPRQRRIYDDLVRDSIALIERRALAMDGADDGYGEVVGDNVLTRMLRLQQITGGYVQIDGASTVEPADPKKNPKLSALVDLAETLRDTGKKLVVFHRFTHEGLAIEKALAKLAGKDRPLSVINGSIKTADRKAAIENFQHGDSIFFVGQIQACAEGITLHAASDSAIYSIPTSAAVYQQALARIHRIGQAHNVTHHHLLGRKTIDEALFTAQLRKEDAARDAVDGGWRRYFHGGD